MSLTGAVNITSFPFNKEEIGHITQDEFANASYPIVYILYDASTLGVYVGESTNAIKRMADHLGHDEKSKLKQVYIISSVTFNKSSALHLESLLIEHIFADDRFSPLNGNNGMIHDYFQKEEYFKMFENIWSRLSFGNIKMKNLLELENSDVFKYSPYKSLSQDQHASVGEILQGFSSGTFSSIFVNGSAGTGKTILAIYLIKLLATFTKHELDDLDIEDEVLLSNLEALKKVYPKNISIGLVVPITSLRATLKKVFGSIHGLSAKMVIGPSEVINDDYDLLIVDESHRLTRRHVLSGYGAFDNVNRKLGLYHSEIINGKEVRSGDKNGTQLDWIMQSSKHQLFFYDAAQSIRPADIQQADFDKVKNLSSSKELTLVSQMRSQGGTDYIHFVNSLLYCLLDKPSEPFYNPSFDLDTPSVFSSTHYDLMLFDDMNDMLSSLRAKEQEHGLCRTVAGFSWPWVSRKEDRPDVVIDNVSLTWNRVTADWINSTTDATEMGCVHTVQGYDLNYVAVIFGEEISYDPDRNKIVINKSCYFDKKGKQLTTDDQLHEYIIKIYKTMMFRGIKGAYIYVCDASLRAYFKKYIQSF
jgi:DUF2075 family protein